MNTVFRNRWYSDIIFLAGKEDRRNIRKIERFEARTEGDLDKKQEKIVHTLEQIATNISSEEVGTQGDQGRRSRSEWLRDVCLVFGRLVGLRFEFQFRLDVNVLILLKNRQM